MAINDVKRFFEQVLEDPILQKRLAGISKENFAEVEKLARDCGYAVSVEDVEMAQRTPWEGNPDRQRLNEIMAAECDDFGPCRGDSWLI